VSDSGRARPASVHSVLRLGRSLDALADRLLRRSSPRTHRCLVESPAVRQFFCGIHRRIGAAQKLGWIVAVCRVHCHSYAQPDDCALAVG